MPPPGKVFLLLAAISIMLGMIGAASQYHRYTRGLSRTYGLLNLNEEASLGTWYAGILLFAGAAGCMLIAWARFQLRQADRWHWLGLAAMFTAFSMDEIVGLHERTQETLRAALGLGGAFHFAWIILAVPLVLLVGFLYLRFVLRLPAGIRNQMMLAAALFVGGAVGVEMLGGLQADAHGQDNLRFMLLAQIEEVLEMLGAAAFFCATLRYLSAALPTLQSPRP